MQEIQFKPARIEKILRDNHLTGAGLAKRIGVAKSLVGAWLSGLVVPQIASLCRLSEAFNVPIAEFFSDAQEADDRKAVAAARRERETLIAGGRR